MLLCALHAIGKSTGIGAFTFIVRTRLLEANKVAGEDVSEQIDENFLKTLSSAGHGNRDHQH
jgi:hypothetical protein